MLTRDLLCIAQAWQFANRVDPVQVLRCRHAVIHRVLLTDLGELVHTIGHCVIVALDSQGTKRDAWEGVPPLKNLEGKLRIRSVHRNHPNARLPASDGDGAVLISCSSHSDCSELTLRV